MTKTVDEQYSHASKELLDTALQHDPHTSCHFIVHFQLEITTQSVTSSTHETDFPRPQLTIIKQQHAGREADRQTGRKAGEAGRHTDRQTDTDTDRQTGRQTDRQADRQTDTDRQTGRQAG